MVKVILKYQEHKKQLVLRVTKCDLIPEHFALTEEDLTPENIQFIKENFISDTSLYNNNCLHCNAYQHTRSVECLGCNYGECSGTSLWGHASVSWERLATQEDKDELFTLGEKLRKELNDE